MDVDRSAVTAEDNNALFINGPPPVTAFETVTLRDIGHGGDSSHRRGHAAAIPTTAAGPSENEVG